MRSVLFMCVACCAVVLGQDINAMKNMPKYDARYDYLDVDAVLDSKRLVRNYVECLINTKPCTPEGKALKRILPEALRTKCVRCTDRQKKTAVKVIRRLKYEYPEDWMKLQSRWDPTGDFTRFFEEFLTKETFNTISGNEIPGSSPPPPPTLPSAGSSARPITPTPTSGSTATPVPVFLNRFGDSGEDTVNSATASPPVKPSPPYPVTVRHPPPPPPTRPNPTRPTVVLWLGTTDSRLPEPYSTAITLIDQIGYKIIRTTELVTDILRNTVRAVIG